MPSSLFSRHFMLVLLDRLQLLFRVSRPGYWIGCPSVYFMGLVHSGTYPLTLPVILFAVAVSFPICLSKSMDTFCFSCLLIRRKVMFGVNDIYDYNSDMQNPRKNRLWADGTVLHQFDHQFVLLAARVSTILVLLLVLPASIQSPQLLGCAVLSLILCWIYSSPPLRLKERPILDSLSSGVGFLLVWACGYTASGNRHLSYTASGNFSSGGWVFFSASALHSISALVDVRADASAKQQTIATVFGERFSAIFSAVCFLFATLSVDLWFELGVASAGLIFSLVILVAPHTASCFQYYVPLGNLMLILWDLKMVYDIQRGQYINMSW